MNDGLPYVLDPPTVVGKVTGYTISPTLPAGVSLNPSTGMISGTPQTGSPETVFTITASNDAGSTTTTIYVTVYWPPSDLTYASPVDATEGTTLADLVPALSGDANRFSVQPALPAGLVLDSATGVVSGTPASERISASYTPVHWASVRTRYGNTHRDLSIFRLAMDPESPDTPYAATTYNAIFSKTSDNLLTAFMHAESHRATTERTETCGQRERSCDI